MIYLPWQIVVAFIGWAVVTQVMAHLKKVDCQERIDAGRRDERRFALAAYQEIFRSAIFHAKDHIKDERDA